MSWAWGGIPVCNGCGGETIAQGMLCEMCSRKEQTWVWPKDGEPYPVPMPGWECPRCRTIHSPFVSRCDCAPPTAANTEP
jgi:hypothetical protein